MVILIATQDGYKEKTFENNESLLNYLQKLEDKDIYIDHKYTPKEDLSITDLKKSDTILIHDKLIGA